MPSAIVYALTDHSACVPGEAGMCGECRRLWNSNNAPKARMEIRYIWHIHPARIMPGFCLACGHGKHSLHCVGYDHWDAPCQCREFMERVQYDRRRRS